MYLTFTKYIDLCQCNGKEDSVPMREQMRYHVGRSRKRVSLNGKTDQAPYL